MEKEKIAKYKRMINFTFFLVFFVFNFQNLIGIEFVNPRFEKIKWQFPSIKTCIKIINCELLTQKSDDCYIVCEKKVLFFSLPQAEIECISEDVQWQILDALDDYYTYSNNLIPYLNANNIPYDFIRVRKIMFIYENGDNEEIKIDMEESLAWILFDGVKKPKINYDIVFTEEMLKEMENYFGIKHK